LTASRKVILPLIQEVISAEVKTSSTNPASEATVPSSGMITDNST
jgi:hypothetical protein